MKKLFKVMAMLSLTVMLVPPAFATNGINLIAIGPISRAMGGSVLPSPWMPSVRFFQTRQPCASANTVRARNLTLPARCSCPKLMQK